MNAARRTALDHTGDVGFELHADTLQALFDAAREALLSELMAAPPAADPGAAEPDGAQPLEVRLAAPALDRLLLRWLDELLFLVQVRGRVPASARLTLQATDAPAAGWRLTARLTTVPLDVRAQRWRGEVKAVTYHGLELVADDDGGWRARVVLDV
jgi:SHS2 domain-containing protein